LRGVLGGIFEPALDPQHMDLGLDAEVAEPVFGHEVLQHATIYPLRSDGCSVHVELQHGEERLHVVHRPLAHRLRCRSRRLVLRSRDSRLGLVQLSGCRFLSGLPGCFRHLLREK
jgi:hypothetical protein